MAQIKKGFIAANAIDGSKLKLLNNEAIRAAQADGSDVELMKLDISNVLQFLTVPQVGSDPSSGNDVSRKSYVDNKVESAKGTLEAALAAETAAREAADAGLSSDISDEQTARQTAVANEQSAREAADLAEQSARTAADSQLASDLEAAIAAFESAGSDEAAARAAADSAEQTAREAADSAETAARIAADSAEESARQAADSALSGRLDVIEGVGEGSVSKAEADAKAYADQKISDLVNSAPEVLDTLKELADALGDDPNFATTVANQIGAEATARADADSMEAAARQAGDQELASDLADEVAARQSAVSQEASDRAAADSAEAAARASGDQAVQANLDQEVSDRQAAVSAEAQSRSNADATLQSNIDAEASARQTAVSDEANARIAGDADLQSQIDSLDSGSSSALAAETSARQAADSALSGRLDVLEADPVTKSYVDTWGGNEADTRATADAAEQAAREAADADLQSQIDALDSGSNAALAQEIADRQAAVSAEQAAREAADSDLQSQVNTEKGRIDAILLASDADKDSFAEIVQLINSVDTENDSAFGSYVISNNAALAQEASDRAAGDAGLASDLADETSARQSADSTLQSNIDSEAAARQAADSAEQTAREQAVSAEAAARQSADDALDVRVDALEAVTSRKEKFVLSSTDVMNGYVDLAVACKADSEMVFIGSLYAHDGDDYTVSTVSGKTRITFAGPLAAGGASEMAANEVVYVRYLSSETGSGGGGGGGGGGQSATITISSSVDIEGTYTIWYDSTGADGLYAALEADNASSWQYQGGLGQVWSMGTYSVPTANLNNGGTYRLRLYTSNMYDSPASPEVVSASFVVTASGGGGGGQTETLLIDSPNVTQGGGIWRSSDLPWGNYARSFGITVPGSGTLSKISLEARTYQAQVGNGTLSLAIKNTVTGSVLATSNGVDVSTLSPGAFEFVDFSFTGSSVALMTGETYAIEAVFSGTGAAVEITRNGSSPYFPGHSYREINTGETAPYDGYATNVKVYVV